MLNRRVTRSVTRAITAANALPAPPPAPPPAPDNDEQALGSKESTRTRSGRIIDQIASTAKKLTAARGRRGRQTTLPNIVEGATGPNDHSESAPTANHQPNHPAPSANAPALRKSARKAATQTKATSINGDNADTSAPATKRGARKPSAPQKQAAPATKSAARKPSASQKQPAAVRNTRARAAKGKGKAVVSAEAATQPDRAHGAQAAAETPIQPDAQPEQPVTTSIKFVHGSNAEAGSSHNNSAPFTKPLAAYDTLTTSILEMNNSILSEEAIHARPRPGYRSLFNRPGFGTVNVTNLFTLAFNVLNPSGVQEQPAIHGLDAGYTTDESTDVEDEDEERPTEKVKAKSGESKQAQAQGPSQQIIFPSVPDDEREPEEVGPKFHPITGAPIISRQNAHIYDERGYPLPDRRGPNTIPEAVGEEVGEVEEVIDTTKATLATKGRSGQPLRRHNAINLGHQKDAPQPPLGSIDDEFPPIENISVAGPSTAESSSGSSGEKEASSTVLRKGVPLRRYKAVMFPSKNSPASATSLTTSTATPVTATDAAPAPRRGVPLRREAAVILPLNDTSLNDTSAAADGKRVAPGGVRLRRYPLEIFNVDSKKASGSSQPAPESSSAHAGPSRAVPAVKSVAAAQTAASDAAPRPTAAAGLAALTRATSQPRLGALTTARQGQAVAFSRQNSQHFENPAATPAPVDKGKARAVDPQSTAVVPQSLRAQDKGKKRAREDDSDVPVPKQTPNQTAAHAPQAPQATHPGYTHVQGPFRVEVSMVPLPFLPTAKRRRTSDVEPAFELRVIAEHPVPKAAASTAPKAQMSSRRSSSSKRPSSAERSSSAKRSRDTYERDMSRTTAEEAPPAKKARIEAR